MHGDILPAIPIVTPNYAVTAAKWQHLPAITILWRYLAAITAYFLSTNGLYSVYSKKSRLSMKKSINLSQTLVCVTLSSTEYIAIF